MAPRVLEALGQEHRQMEKLLDLLGRQIVLIADRREADTELLFEIADFFRSYPDLYHHPKEDLIVRQLAARAPSAAEDLTILEMEHEEGSRLLICFCRALVNFSMEPEAGRQPFLDASRVFLDNERRHIAWEEERFLPTAEILLNNEDWATIDKKIALLAVPDFERDARARFSRVGREIGRWRGTSIA